MTFGLLNFFKAAETKKIHLPKPPLQIIDHKTSEAQTHHSLLPTKNRFNETPSNGNQKSKAKPEGSALKQQS